MRREYVEGVMDSTGPLAMGHLSEGVAALTDPTYTDKGLDKMLDDMFCDQTISQADAVARRDGDHYGERLMAMLPTATSYDATRAYRTGKLVMNGETHVASEVRYSLCVHSDNVDMLAYGKGGSWEEAFAMAVRDIPEHAADANRAA